MSPSRRDILKIASAIGLGAALPPVATRIDALKLLTESDSPQVLANPGAFAIAAGCAIEDETNQWFSAIVPQEQAAYTQAREVLLRAEPQIVAAGCQHPFHAFDDSGTTLFVAAYEAGVRHGAAFEHLRRTVIGEVMECQTCWSRGILDSGATCAACAGTGTVALKT